MINFNDIGNSCFLTAIDEIYFDTIGDEELLQILIDKKIIYSEVHYMEDNIAYFIIEDVYSMLAPYFIFGTDGAHPLNVTIKLGDGPTLESKTFEVLWCDNYTFYKFQDAPNGAIMSNVLYRVLLNGETNRINFVCTQDTTLTFDIKTTLGEFSTTQIFSPQKNSNWNYVDVNTEIIAWYINSDENIKLYNDVSFEDILSFSVDTGYQKIIFDVNDMPIFLFKNFRFINNLGFIEIIRIPGIEIIEQKFQNNIDLSRKFLVESNRENFWEREFSTAILYPSQIDMIKQFFISPKIWIDDEQYRNEEIILTKIDNKSSSADGALYSAKFSYRLANFNKL